MKYFLSLICLFFVYSIVEAQYTYTISFYDIDKIEKLENIYNCFKDLNVKECYLDTNSFSMIIRTKTRLPNAIMKDYMEGNGYLIKHYENIINSTSIEGLKLVEINKKE